MKSIDIMFHRTNVKRLNDNFFKILDDEWMLVTAGRPGDFNMMTASWGTTGILWNMPVAICFIRPNRYTFQFAEKSDYYTLSFFESSYRKILNICGTRSGRDIDKIRETGLVPVITEYENIGYEQARMVMECKILYADYLEERHFIISEIARKNYLSKDFHRFYIGEIVNCYLKS
ncbi:MAG: flavin reductase [Bacteroidales bacterium]|nr:flavin reductase [Bacteroidales bacterium]